MRITARQVLAVLALVLAVISVFPTGFPSPLTAAVVLLAMAWLIS